MHDTLVSAAAVPESVIIVAAGIDETKGIGLRAAMLKNDMKTISEL